MKPDKNTSVLKCSVCDEQLESELELEEHVQISHLSAHVKKNENSFHCFSCSEAVPSRVEMIDHIKMCHSENIVEKSDDTRLECDSCGKRYRYRRGLIEHIRILHKDQISRKIDYDSVRNNVCFTCGKKYSYKRGLLAHVKYRHPELVAKRKKNYICEICNRSYSYGRGLREHMKTQHIREIKQPVFENSCGICGKKFARSRSLSKHMKKQHMEEMNVDDVEPQYYICFVCDKVYESRRGISDHITKSHPSVTDADTIQNEIFKCTTCSKTFVRRNSLLLHIRKNHSGKLMKFLKKQAIRVCPFCMTSFDKKILIVDHLIKAHDIKLQYKSAVYYDENAFLEWKHKMEQTTRSHYVLYKRYRSKTENVVLYVCHRSGLICEDASTNAVNRRLSGGFSEVNCFCPAEIRLRVRRDCLKYVVDFCSTHIGHKNVQLRKLPKLERIEEADTQLLDNVSVSSSPNVADHDDEDEDDEDEHSTHSYCEFPLYESTDNDNFESFSNGLLSLRAEKDDDSDRVDVGRCISNDASSIDAWIRDHENFVLYSKRRGVEDRRYSRLPKSDYLLIIATDGQLDMLKTFGSNIVAVDRCSQTLDDHIFDLFTVSVFNKLYIECVCVYMISSRPLDDDIEDHKDDDDDNDDDTNYIYRVLLQELRNRVGLVETRVFISDVSNRYSKAWECIMSAPQCRLYCDWHVYQDWNRNLRRILSPTKRYETRKLLQSLKNELNLFRFHALLESWSSDQDVDLNEFKKYFDDIYAKCPSYWAYCYRKYAGVNTSTAAEQFLKSIRKKLGTPVTLEQILNSLEDTIVNLYVENIGIETYDNFVPKLKTLRDRHSVAVKHKNKAQYINQLTNTQWYVPNVESVDDDDEENAMHHVEMVKSICDCDIRCELCGSCLHMFVCSCIDNCIEYNMCEHIHLVCLYHERNLLEGAEEEIIELLEEEEIPVCELIESKTFVVDELTQRPVLGELINQFALKETYS